MRLTDGYAMVNTQCKEFWSELTIKRLYIKKGRKVIKSHKTARN